MNTIQPPPSSNKEYGQFYKFIPGTTKSPVFIFFPLLPLFHKFFTFFDSQ